MNKVKLFFFLVSISAMFFLLAKCKHSPTEEVLPIRPNDSGNNQIIPPKDTICFSSDILPLIISTCAKPGCHDAIYRKEGLTLTNYNSVKSILQNANPYTSNKGLYKIASGSTNINMHITTPSTLNLTPMDSSSLAKLKKWIDQGAINSICNNCDTINVKFSTHIKPLIQSYCAGCHTATSGTMLSNYTQVKIAIDNGKFYCAINQTTGCLPMPQGGTKLSDCKVRMVKIWIDAGALNN